MVKIWIEWNENCWNYAACRFKKTYFEKNAFKVLRCVSEQFDALWKKLGISKKKILYRHKTFFLILKGSRISKKHLIFSLLQWRYSWKVSVSTCNTSTHAQKYSTKFSFLFLSAFKTYITMKFFYSIFRE